MMVQTILVVVAIAAHAGAALGPRYHRELSYVGSGLFALATAWLAFDFVAGRFRLLYVIDNSRAAGSAVERLGGLWAGPEGSLLLFVTMMAAWLAVTRPDGGVGSRLTSLLVAALGLIVIAVASPFVASPQPLADGTGLTPILEHPAMAFHPPLLYAGLTGLIVTGLRTGLDQVPLRYARTALAMATLGLVSGARWAFAEVGWGGYWAWDPIENGGLVAVLVAVAALHAPVRFRSSLWVAAAVSGVWATTITRVGVIGSVHAFADKPALRYALLTVSVVLTIGAFLAVRFWGVGVGAARRAKADRVGTSRSQLGAAVLVVLVLLIGVGTYRPLLGWVLGQTPSVVSGRYFSVITWLPVVVGLGGLFRYRWIRAARSSLVAGMALAVVLLLLAGTGGSIPAYVLVAGGGFVAGSGLIELRQRPAALAHVGIGLLVAGIGGTTMGTAETVTIPVGESVEFAGATVRHEGIDLITGLVGSSAEARFELDGSPMASSILTQNLRGTATVEAATRLGVRGEYLIVFSDGNDEAARYRMTYLPLLPLVWLGGVLTALGLGLSAAWPCVESPRGLRSFPATSRRPFG